MLIRPEQIAEIDLLIVSHQRMLSVSIKSQMRFGS